MKWTLLRDTNNKNEQEQVSIFSSTWRRWTLSDILRTSSEALFSEFTNISFSCFRIDTWQIPDIILTIMKRHLQTVIERTSIQRPPPWSTFEKAPQRSEEIQNFLAPFFDSQLSTGRTRHFLLAHHGLPLSKILSSMGNQRGRERERHRQRDKFKQI